MLLCSLIQVFPLPPPSLVIIIYYCLFLLLVEVGFCLMWAESWDAHLFLKLRPLGQQASSQTRK